MLKSKRGYLASELCGYWVIDRYSKKVGQVKDLVINSISYSIDYILVDKNYFIPVSLIDNDHPTKKTIMLTQIKKQLISERKKRFPSKKYIYFSKIKDTIVYDLTGSKLGPIKNIAFHTGLRVDLLVGKPGRDAFFLDQNYFVVPSEYICDLEKDYITLCVLKEDLKVVNLTGFEYLFVKTRQNHGAKKRYIIVEAPATTIKHYLHQREDILQEVNETLFIEELDILNEIKLSKFVKLFNKILKISPDTFIPLSKRDAMKYFKYGTFLAFQQRQAIGYCSVYIEKQEKVDQRTGAIAGIGVDPSHRGKYVALALIDYSLKYLIKNQVDKIQADIYELNIPSLKLFSSLGFHEIGETYLV